MKKQSIFFALMSLVAMGVAFTSCTNVDNPYNPTPSDGKYVMAKDSVVYTSGDVHVKNWEYDDEGNMVKETIDYCYADGTTDQVVSTYTYTPGLITCNATYLNGDTRLFYYRLNDKGLIEQYESVTDEMVHDYKYDDDGHMIWYSEDGSDETITWKNGDVEKYDYGYGVTYFSWTNYEINFPYLIDFVGCYDDILAYMGYFGKATRHLMAGFNYDIEGEGYSERRVDNYSYVVLGGLVKEFATASHIVAVDGESNYVEDFGEHHYITWQKQ